MAQQLVEPCLTNVDVGNSLLSMGEMPREETEGD
jgi:hypothetical protein